jgi:hypothetical protein
MNYTESEAAQLNAFFDLNEKTYPYFDFLFLIDAVIGIFNRKDWKFYMDEFNNYANGFSGTPSIIKAHEFLIFIKNALTKNLNSKVFFLQYPIYSTAKADDDFDDLAALLSDAPMANDLPSLHYQFLENEEDLLVVSPQNYKVISRIFKNAKATILGEPNSESNESDDDDILNFL